MPVPLLTPLSLISIPEIPPRSLSDAALIVNPPDATGFIVMLEPAVIFTSSLVDPSLNLNITSLLLSTASKVYVLPASLVALKVVAEICNPVPRERCVAFPSLSSQKNIRSAPGSSADIIPPVTLIMSAIVLFGVNPAPATAAIVN